MKEITWFLYGKHAVTMKLNVGNFDASYMKTCRTVLATARLEIQRIPQASEGLWDVESPRLGLPVSYTQLSVSMQ